MKTQSVSVSTLSRRTLITGLAAMSAASLIAAGLEPVSAGQTDDTTSGNPLSELGYPELRIVVNDQGFEALAEIPAGKTLIVLENQGSPEGAAAVTDINFLQLPAGVDLDDLNSALSAGDGSVPEWFADIVSTGGFKTGAGQTGYGVIELEAGAWAVGAGDTNPFVLLTVGEASSESPTAGLAPEAEIDIVFAGDSIPLPEQMQTGPLVWHVTNDDVQSHEIMIVRTPELLTAEQVLTILTLPEGEPPPPGVPDPSTLEFPPVGIQTMSGGRELWVEMNLESGFYVGLCVVPDAESGAPHAALGEIAIFTVVD